MWVFIPRITTRHRRTTQMKKIRRTAPTILHLPPYMHSSPLISEAQSYLLSIDHKVIPPFPLAPTVTLTTQCSSLPTSWSLALIFPPTNFTQPYAYPSTRTAATTMPTAVAGAHRGMMAREPATTAAHPPPTAMPLDIATTTDLRLDMYELGSLDAYLC